MVRRRASLETRPERQDRAHRHRLPRRARAFHDRQREPAAGESIVVTLRDGPFRHLHGEWRFSPLAPDACKVEFELAYEFATHVLERVVGPVFATSPTRSSMRSSVAPKPSTRGRHERHRRLGDAELQDIVPVELPAGASVADAVRNPISWPVTASTQPRSSSRASARRSTAMPGSLAGDRIDICAASSSTPRPPARGARAPDRLRDGHPAASRTTRAERLSPERDLPGVLYSRTMPPCIRIPFAPRWYCRVAGRGLVLRRADGHRAGCGRPLARRIRHVDGERRRGHRAPVGAGPDVGRARPHRHPLQVGRQHARVRARLQRTRPLRVPAGHGRHAAAHREGHEPSRRGGRA